MSLNDVRVRWLRDQALASLGLSDPAPFEELLNRHGGEGARTVLSFFSRGAEDDEERKAAGVLLLRVERRPQETEEAAGEAALLARPAGPSLVLPSPETLPAALSPAVPPSFRPLHVPSLESQSLSLPHSLPHHPLSCAQLITQKLPKQLLAEARVLLWCFISIKEFCSYCSKLSIKSDLCISRLKE